MSIQLYETHVLTLDAEGEDVEVLKVEIEQGACDALRGLTGYPPMLYVHIPPTHGPAIKAWWSELRTRIESDDALITPSHLVLEIGIRPDVGAGLPEAASDPAPALYFRAAVHLCSSVMRDFGDPDMPKVDLARKLIVAFGKAAAAPQTVPGALAAVVSAGAGAAGVSSLVAPVQAWVEHQGDARSGVETLLRAVRPSSHHVQLDQVLDRDVALAQFAYPDWPADFTDNEHFSLAFTRVLRRVHGQIISMQEAMERPEMPDAPFSEDPPELLQYLSSFLFEEYPNVAEQDRVTWDRAWLLTEAMVMLGFGGVFGPPESEREAGRAVMVHVLRAVSGFFGDACCGEDVPRTLPFWPHDRDQPDTERDAHVRILAARMLLMKSPDPTVDPEGFLNIAQSAYTMLEPFQADPSHGETVFQLRQIEIMVPLYKLATRLDVDQTEMLQALEEDRLPGLDALRDGLAALGNGTGGAGVASGSSEDAGFPLWVLAVLVLLVLVFGYFMFM